MIRRWLGWPLLQAPAADIGPASNCSPECVPSDHGAESGTARWVFAGNLLHHGGRTFGLSQLYRPFPPAAGRRLPNCPIILHLPVLHVTS